MDPNRPPSRKICTLDELLKHRRNAKTLGERVVHCHGCFDIVHPGHVRHLEHARQFGERLLVSLTADEFVNKGDARPMFSESMRAENLAALSCVDWVVINPSPTASDLLLRVQPDVYVKGAEYENNNDPRFAAERDAVERSGGRVVFTSGDVVFSSTALVDAMRRGGIQNDPFGFEAPISPLRSLHQTHDLSPPHIQSILEGMRGVPIAIVGESIIDTYVDCSWPEVTGEAPILTLRPHKRVSFDGGAAILARHAAAVGAIPHLITPISNSSEGRALQKRLEESGIIVEPIATDTPMPQKERLLVGREKLVKLDHSTPIELDHRTRVRLVETAQRLGDRVEGAIVVDFGHGMLGPRMTSDLFSVFRLRVRVLSGDVSGPRASLHHMLGADWLTPSERELRGALAAVTDSLPAVAAELMQRTNASHIAVTMADQGVIIFKHRDVTDTPDGQPVMLSSEHIPALNQTPLDTLGCGDALLTMSTLAQLAGADAGLSAYIGSLAAAVCASKLGNHPCKPLEMLQLAHHLYRGLDSETVERAIPVALG